MVYYNVQKLFAEGGRKEGEDVRMRGDSAMVVGWIDAPAFCNVLVSYLLIYLLIILIEI